MAEPRIQYAKTEDGVNIAYWTLGEGEPLVMTPGDALGAAMATWENPEGRAYLETLAQNRLVIRYDHRGGGHSEHDLTDLSFDDYIADIEAVAMGAGLDNFALFGVAYSSPFAIGYAVRHPETVSNLVLWNSAVKGADLLNVDA